MKAKSFLAVVLLSVAPRTFISVIVYFLLFSANSFAQGTWTARLNLSGVARSGAVGFSIGMKGYVGTGGIGISGTYYNDFWQWDQATNTWTQMANFGGAARKDAVGFSIGKKGYIGTGASAAAPFYMQDLWEWDGDISSPTYNTWIQKANFSGGGRWGAVGFSLGGKGYIGTGGSPGCLRDFWEYTPGAGLMGGSWTQMADFAVTGNGYRHFCVGFSIGTKGYIGTGKTCATPIGTNGYKQDFWEWDQGTNTWIQIANLPGAGRAEATAFTIGKYGYVGLGTINWNPPGGSISDFWKYDPSVNTWTSVPNFGGGLRELAASFSIGCYGYVATGFMNDINSTIQKDLWEYYDVSDTTCSCSSTITAANVSCNGGNNGSATITATGGTSPYMYSWSPSGGTNANATGLTASTYTVMITDAVGCTQTKTITITEPPVFITTATAAPANINPGASTTLSATGGGTYSWSPSIGLSCISCQNPIAAPMVTTVYCVTVTDANNCKATACVNVTVIPEPPLDCSNAGNFYFPNTFSPNNDGENDMLNIYYGDIKCIETFKLVIYNRWGEKVFQTSDPVFKWDGSYKNTHTNTAVFVYYLDVTLINGETIIKRGNISLIR